MPDKFTIKLDDKPALSELAENNLPVLKDIIGTFVSLMEVAAAEKWYELPEMIHSSLSFSDVVTGVLNAVMNTEMIEPSAYATLEQDLHPLGLLSNKRNNLITGERETYDWRAHFVLDDKKVNRETLEKIIRKMLYLVRWIDLDTVSKQLISRDFTDVPDESEKLPFQPALAYQKEKMGELYVGKFFHDVGAFDCGELEGHERFCPACEVGELKPVTKSETYMVCPRCNAGYHDH